MTMNRRVFLRKTAYYGLGAATLNQAIQTFSVTNALAQTSGGPYRALVCVFLNGGNDANNMLVPIGSGPYGSYTNYSGARSAQGLALPQPGTGAVNDLLPLLNGNPVPANAGGALSSFAFHPSMNNLRDLFNQGRLAVACNVGPLVRTYGSATQTPRQQFLAAPSSQRPFQLFSHSDQIQQWQTAKSNSPSSTGWGGRLADQIDPMSTALPQITSISGKPVFTVGNTTSPLSIGTGALNQVLVLNGFGSTEMARVLAFDALRGPGHRANQVVAATSDIMSQARQVQQQLSVDPVINTVFPNTTLGNQLRQVAKVIKANLQNINPPLNRQIFFAQVGGWDTHSNELTGQGGAVNGTTLTRGLLGQVNDALFAFYNSLQELNGISAGLSSRVTAFTMSDFNRTYNPAGSGATVGTDHSWGHFQLVLGDGVNGGRFYGVPFAGSGGTGTIIPLYTNGGAYDTGSRGSWIPTASVDQYANTLAAWYGLPQGGAEVSNVFPLLSGFSPATLGFML